MNNNELNSSPDSSDDDDRSACTCKPRPTYRLIELDEYDYEIVREEPESCCFRPLISPATFISILLGLTCLAFIGGVIFVWLSANNCQPDLPTPTTAAAAIRGRNCVKTALIYPAACYQANNPDYTKIDQFAHTARSWTASFNALPDTGYTALVVQKSKYSMTLTIVSNTTSISACTWYSTF